MYESKFSYGLTRPYPFKWFTPVVLVGGILATALFSFLNFAANGYEMITIESSDPNVTVASGTIFSKWPSLIGSKTRPSCDSRTLSVGQSYFTNNTALAYRLDEVWQEEGPDKSRKHFGDLPYLNNMLKNCKIPHQLLFFEHMDRNAAQVARQRWGVLSRSTVICDVDTAEGTYTVQLIVEYDLNSDLSHFPGSDAKTKASIWWGESLLAWYYIDLTRRISGALQWTRKKAYMMLKPNTPAATDLTLATFFNASAYVWFGIDDDLPVLFGDDIAVDAVELVPAAESLSLLFYSTIMADLGQQGPNILNDPKLLEQFSANITEISAAKPPPGFGFSMNFYRPNLATGPYAPSNASQWDLSIGASVFPATYLCQVPILKSTGSLVFSLLVADLVLLQALWKIFVLAVDTWMLERLPAMRNCKTCEGDNSSVTREDDGNRLLGQIQSSDDLTPTPA